MGSDWVRLWLGPPRLQRYIDEAHGDSDLALELYEWNVSAGLALMRDIAHFEIALRNAYDRAIGSSWPHSTHWLLHPESPVVMPVWRIRRVDGMKRGFDVNSRTRSTVENALRSCGYGAAAPGQVMSQLSFGFWRHLTAKALEKSLWVPHLHRAFPVGVDRQHVDRQIAAANALQNRIAHHEPLVGRAHSADPLRTHQGMLEVLRLIMPDAHHHVTSSSQAASVLAERPSTAR